MNIHERAMVAMLAEKTEEGLRLGVDPEQLVYEQLDLIHHMQEAMTRSHKLDGTCIRCNGPIPIGGRLICNGTATSALCADCGAYSRQLINDLLAKKRTQDVTNR